MLLVLTDIIANITHQERKTVEYCTDNTFKVYYRSAPPLKKFFLS
jgi:hypothetical protein